MAGLSQYKSIAGEPAGFSAQWPSDSRIERTDRPTLIMFAHPMCACTRASLSELRVLMSEFGGRVTAHVLFALPAGVGEEWSKSDLWRSAASIDGVAVAPDVDEKEAHLFGARTSGHVVLYDGDGRLLFSGGITGARGHAGDNSGLARVSSRLRNGGDRSAGGPVFGCPLQESR